MWKATHEDVHEGVHRENYTLRDALREANNEVRRHRKLIAELGNDPDILAKFLKSKQKVKP